VVVYIRRPEESEVDQDCATAAVQVLIISESPFVNCYQYNPLLIILASRHGVEVLIGKHEDSTLTYQNYVGSSVSIATRLLAGRPRFHSRQELRWEFLSSPPRPDLLWVPPSILKNGYRGLPPGIKRSGSEGDQSPPYTAEVKNAWNYTSTPSVRLHGVMLNK
jgi:hypothetical protein